MIQRTYELCMTYLRYLYIIVKKLDIKKLYTVLMMIVHCAFNNCTLNLYTLSYDCIVIVHWPSDESSLNVHWLAEHFSNCSVTFPFTELHGLVLCSTVIVVKIVFFLFEMFVSPRYCEIIKFCLIFVNILGMPLSLEFQTTTKCINLYVLLYRNHLHETKIVKYPQ